mgnify:FL=1
MNLRQVCCIAIVGMCLGVPGCRRSGSSGATVSRWGVAWNEERRRLGIPEIPEDWVPSDDADESRTIWRRKTGLWKQGDGARYEKKILWHPGGVLMSEIDVYSSGQVSRFMPEEFSPMELHIEYSHQLREQWKKEWVSCITTGSEGRTMTLEEAEQALRAWGIGKRPVHTEK